ncbi:hypothetical protein A8C56_06995 [Niabella ginsenosidivorans]|uniref:Uncharacterized protein n=1 Tax=Niabella ginsenosidivorans TaxID=1176587 RepID=A0A1A9I114_9BACT|nr:hypothetical protein [Niabella ginsenosidivorans]ANH80759.1 hypothetical protein A8C56_06995 [Niabella ginsenosidivorans]
MRWLIFLSKVAFLCGVTVILALSLLFYEWNKGETVSSSIITSGYVLGLVMIPLINVIYLICWAAGKKPGAIVPKWIIIFNILCLLLIFVYIFFINDPYYHQA